MMQPSRAQPPKLEPAATLSSETVAMTGTGGLLAPRLPGTSVHT